MDDAARRLVFERSFSFDRLLIAIGNYDLVKGGFEEVQKRDAWTISLRKVGEDPAK